MKKIGLNFNNITKLKTMVWPTFQNRSTLVFDRLTVAFYYVSALILMIGLLCLVFDQPSGLSVPGNKNENRSFTDRFSFTRKNTLFDDYKGIFDARQIFQEAADLKDTLSAQSSGANYNWNTNYELVGVIMGDKPTAAIKVRNPAGTVMLSIGDSLGGAVLERIETEGIWLRFQGQLIQLGFSNGPK